MPRKPTIPDRYDQGPETNIPALRQRNGRGRRKVWHHHPIYGLLEGRLMETFYVGKQRRYKVEFCNEDGSVKMLVIASEHLFMLTRPERSHDAV